MVELLARKDALAKQHAQSQQRANGGIMPFYVSNSIAANQQSQTTYYYCGPAALSEALGQLGIGLSQDSSASLLQTTTDGTAWSGININVPSPTGYPVPDALNYKLGTNWYGPVNVPYTPGSGDYTNFQNRLQSDIDQSHPLIGDAYEVQNGPHLVGHPMNYTIYHYFDIRGYDNSGALTMYEDSVSGASSIAWSPSVPAYSTMSSNTITDIVGARGYVW